MFTKTLYVDPHDPNASDENLGTRERPLQTIDRAAQLLHPGERVVVASGTYRECIRPRRGGTGPDTMISYEAAPGAKVIIKGSHVVSLKWKQSRREGEPVSDNLFMVALKQEMFESYDPFLTENASEKDFELMGWATHLAGKLPYTLGRGLVFQDGRRLVQLACYEDLLAVTGSFWFDKDTRLLHVHPYRNVNPSDAVFEITTQAHLLEPTKTDLGYIRIRGFIFEHAANGFPRTGVGDVNGDRCDDLLVATRHYPSGGNEGRAYLYLGAKGTGLNTKPAVIFGCPDSGVNEFGSSADLFDIDNNGCAEVIVGARRYPDGRSLGRGYLYWGKTEGFENTVGLTLTGEASSIALGGDFINCGYADEDEYGDILITAFGYNGEQSRAYLYLGGTQGTMDAVADYVFTPEPGKNGVFRSALADLNNDGNADVLMGGPYHNNHQGRAWLWYGPFTTTTNLTFNWDTTNASIGTHMLRVEVPPVPGEQNTEDNTRTLTIEVKEPPK